MRGSILIKFIKTIELLSKPYGTTIDEIAEELGVERRSAYRELNVVEELGFPLWEDDPLDGERKKRWKLEKDYVKTLSNSKVPNISFTLSEVIAMYLLRGEGKLFKGTTIEKELDTAFGKMNMFVPDGLYDKLKKVRTLFASSSKFSKDYSGKEEIIDDITDAMLRNKTSRIKYHSFSSDEVKEYDIDPLSFVENNGGLYIYVRVPSYDSIRLLAVERIQELKMTDKTFTYPKDFDPDEKLDSAFDVTHDEEISVKVWFSKEQARYIKERQWASTQKITDQDDGSIIFEMETSGLWDVKSWILRYGADAKALEPEELKEQIVEELKAAQNLYLESMCQA